MTCKGILSRLAISTLISDLLRVASPEPARVGSLMSFQEKLEEDHHVSESSNNALWQK